LSGKCQGISECLQSGHPDKCTVLVHRIEINDYLSALSNEDDVMIVQACVCVCVCVCVFVGADMGRHKAVFITRITYIFN